MEESKKKSKKEQSTELSISPRNAMQDKLNAITEKLKSIEVMSQSPYKTNKMLPHLFEHKKVDISECTDITFLVNGLATIKVQKAAYDDIYTNVLKMNSYPVFKSFGGYSYEDWENDIKLRLSVLMQEETVKKLTNAKEKLEKFLTNDDRLAIVLGEISEMGI